MDQGRTCADRMLLERLHDPPENGDVDVRDSSRILFVDDEAPARRAFARIMTRHGFLVDVATGGMEAMRMAKQHAYPVVATDLQMPDMDGLSLVEHLRTVHPDTVFIFVTGCPQFDLDRLPHPDRSAYQVLNKPWDEHELVHTITRAMELRGGRRTPSYGSILLLEDNLADADLIRARLGSWLSIENAELRHVCTLRDATRALYDEPTAVILADLSLPDAAGLDAVRRLHATAADSAIVVLTGLDDDELGLRAIELGAQDYLSKNSASGASLSRAIRFAFERKRAARRLARLAYHDPLTGLANRALFSDRLQRAIAAASRAGSRLAIVFVDLDDFKPVNDRYGHDVGDELLQEIACRLKGATRASDTVARLGGDEFALLIEDLGSTEDIVRTLERLVLRFEEPVGLQRCEITVGASIGAAVSSAGGQEGAGLLKQADQAMYAAKARPGTSWEVYTTESSPAGESSPMDESA